MNPIHLRRSKWNAESPLVGTPLSRICKPFIVTLQNSRYRFRSCSIRLRITPSTLILNHAPLRVCPLGPCYCSRMCIFLLLYIGPIFIVSSALLCSGAWNFFRDLSIDRLCIECGEARCSPQNEIGPLLVLTFIPPRKCFNMLHGDDPEQTGVKIPPIHAEKF